MTNILAKLQYLEFPECTNEALNYLVYTFSETNREIPARGAADNYALEVAQEYILDISRKKGHRSRKLNAVHELQLIELVCSTLQTAPEHSRFSIFSAIFGGHVDAVKIGLLTKLVSISISTSCSPVLGCVALWMQEQGSQSQCVCDVAQRLVDDFCLLYPNTGPTFKNLPTVSTLFTCNLITALTTIYTYTDASKTPPPELLDCIVDWISADPCLCSDSVRLVRIRSNFTCPLSGLVRWCILGPLVTSFSSDFTSGEPSQNANNKTLTNDKLSSLFSKLHLGVLLSLQAYKSMELNEQLFSYTDTYVVSKTLAAYYRDGQCSKNVLEMVNMSVDRLAQTIQVALTTRSLSDKVDLRQLCEGLPNNRLLQIILTARYGRRQTEAMDLS